ncbi:hypothetical protein RI054_27g113190 [Pseudoscourfieldia marina]
MPPSSDDEDDNVSGVLRTTALRYLTLAHLSLAHSQPPRPTRTQTEAEAGDELVHPCCVRLHLTNDGTSIVTSSSSSSSEEEEEEERVGKGQGRHYVSHVTQLDQRTACVALKTCGENGTVKRAVILTLLRSDDDGWRVIADVSTSCARDCKLASPDDFASVTSMCWDGYVAANRACDGTAMAKVFHPLCRLTFAVEAEAGAVTAVDADTFCRCFVAKRMDNPTFSPYKDQQEFSASRDSLLGVYFAAPNLALVQLRVGFAPLLYTDLLTCMRLNNGRWWIVAKSSINEPHVPT